LKSEVGLARFLASRVGWGNRAGLIFCSFCIKAKGKEEYFLSVLSLMKSTKNPARTTLSLHSAKTAEIRAKSV